jgi:hypothetical protein
MIENNQSRHAPLDTLVRVRCNVELANVLIQSGAPEKPGTIELLDRPDMLEMPDMPDMPNMPNMPKITSMRDVRLNARHSLRCAIAGDRRRGGLGLGQP